jgi:hypothetical protein
MKEQPVPRQWSEIEVAIENMTVFGIHSIMKISIPKFVNIGKSSNGF